MVYSTRPVVFCLNLCYFVLVFFSPFSIAITSLGEERAILSAFRTFVRFALVWFCLFPLPLGVWEGLRFVIVALPGLFSYLFWTSSLLLYKVFVLIKDKYHMSLTNPKGSIVFYFIYPFVLSSKDKRQPTRLSHIYTADSRQHKNTLCI